MDYLIYNLADAHLHPLADATLLSADERAAAQKRGERYLLTRCLLRRELARRLGMEPQDIRFRYSELGKPECENAPTPLHFNLSHSGNTLALAFDSQTPIGIDVEQLRPRARVAELAERIMCPEQLAAFRERGCPQGEFFTCWCAAEALVKQAAGSIWQARDIPFVYENGRIRLLGNAAAGLSVRPFTPMPGYAGAVAFRVSGDESMQPQQVQPPQQP